MEFNDYQKKSRVHAFYPNQNSPESYQYLVLGLVGEAGELAEHYKHALRDDGGEITEDTRRLVSKELGDVLWYLANLAYELGYDFEDVAKSNLQKIEDRVKHGTLKGRGSDR